MTCNHQNAYRVETKPLTYGCPDCGHLFHHRPRIDPTTLPYNVLSLGAGVQSSTMALMAAKGQITPMPDFAVFADTMAEPRHVYTWLEWLKEQLPFPVHVVTKKQGLRESIIEAGKKNGSRFASAPFYTTSEKNAAGGMLRRQCTREFKIEVITKTVRENALGLKPRQRAPKTATVAQWIGISTDEMQRMKDPQEPWIVARFPLIDLGMSRSDCLQWWRDEGYNDLPKRSSCTFCPYHDDAHWQDMKVNDPESFEDACQIDEYIRDGWGKTNQQVYVHRSRIPLREIDFNDVDAPTVDFNDECDGMCGV